MTERPSPLRCVLWDFGDTLADERWMLAAPEGFPAWPEVWSEIAGGELADDWNLGRVDAAAVVGAVAARLGMPFADARRHVISCCRRIVFHGGPMEIARRSTLRQALVTVNPDGFSAWVVPHHRLDRIFSPIVTSWESRTLDKGEMGRLALHSIDPALGPEAALLIDNKEHNLDAWRALGGRVYHFRGEDRFARDLEGPLRELAVSAR